LSSTRVLINSGLIEMESAVRITNKFCLQMVLSCQRNTG